MFLKLCTIFEKSQQGHKYASSLKHFFSPKLCPEKVLKCGNMCKSKFMFQKSSKTVLAWKNIEKFHYVYFF